MLNIRQNGTKKRQSRKSRAKEGGIQNSRSGAYRLVPEVERRGRTIVMYTVPVYVKWQRGRKREKKNSFDQWQERNAHMHS